MKVFVTGAPGFVGTATTKNLIANGHTVLGLARSDKSAAHLESLGAQVVRGDLEDLPSLQNGARQADATIHLAFHHDFTNLNKAVDMDKAAITAMADALKGSGKALVIASPTMILPKGQLATENTPAEIIEGDPFSLRGESANLIAKLGRENGFRGIVVRLPPTVHGKGDQGMIPMFVAPMKAAGKVVVLGPGAARWPAVHVSDAADVFRLAAENGVSGGTYHAVGEGGVPLADVFGVVSRKLGMELSHEDFAGVSAVLGQFGGLLAADNPTSSEKTQQELGWRPNGVALLKDLEENYWF